jgi:dihydrodipicolinate synthase/N-acetylneuraminate lyase
MAPWPVVPTSVTRQAEPRVDAAAPVRIMNRLLAASVDGLWVLGVGEQQWSSRSERGGVVRTVLAAAGDAPMTVGATAGETAPSVASARHLQSAGM